MPLTTNQKKKKKIVVLKGCLFLFYATINHLSVMTCDKPGTAYNNRQQLVQWLHQEVPKHFPELNLNQTRSWISLVVCCWYDPRQLSESQQSDFIWEVCSQIRCTENRRPAVDQQRGPNSPWQCPTTHHTTKTSKAERIGLQGFASSAIFLWPLANQLLLLQVSRQLFAEEMLPQPAWGRKCFPKVCQILMMDFFFWSWIFMP